MKRMVLIASLVTMLAAFASQAQAGLFVYRRPVARTAARVVLPPYGVVRRPYVYGRPVYRGPVYGGPVYGGPVYGYPYYGYPRGGVSVGVGVY